MIIGICVSLGKLTFLIQAGFQLLATMIRELGF